MIFSTTFTSSFSPFFLSSSEEGTWNGEMVGELLVLLFVGIVELEGGDLGRGVG